MIIYKLAINPVVYSQEVAATAGLYTSVKAAKRAMQRMVNGEQVTWHSENGYIWGMTSDYSTSCSITEVKVKE